MWREQKGGRRGVGDGKEVLSPTLSPHFSHGPNVKNSFARPKFRSRRKRTLATQATVFITRDNHLPTISTVIGT